MEGGGARSCRLEGEERMGTGTVEGSHFLKVYHRGQRGKS